MCKYGLDGVWIRWNMEYGLYGLDYMEYGLEDRILEALLTSY
ncbi:17048_t:CDS:2 [Entrophospora sp. SA101]|nr:17048_t:CDS:2 [Entrophospora sp. SA101]